MAFCLIRRCSETSKRIVDSAEKIGELDPVGGSSH